MTNVIPVPGFYATSRREKAEIVAIRGCYAIGFCGDNALVWTVRDGSAYPDQHPAYTIIGPWREPRKPLVRWAHVVNNDNGTDCISGSMFPDEGSARFFVTPDVKGIVRFDETKFIPMVKL
jgi:hypothetical protein